MIAFDHFGTVGNRNEYSTKQVQTVSLQPNYVPTLPGKTKISTKTADRLLQCIVFNQLFQTFAESRSVFAFFSCLLENSFGVLLTKNLLHSRGFYQKFIFKLNMVNFSM